VCARISDKEIQYPQLKINHLSDTPSTKAAGGEIFSGVFQQGRQGTTQGQEDLSSVGTSSSNIYFKLASSKIKDDSS
jgi:hypothetical protein